MRLWPLVLLAGCGFLAETFGGIGVRVEVPPYLDAVAYRVHAPGEGGNLGPVYREGRLPIRDGVAEGRVALPEGGGEVVLEGLRGDGVYHRLVRQAKPSQGTLQVRFGLENRVLVRPTVLFTGTEGVVLEPGFLVVCALPPTGYSSFPDGRCPAGREALGTWPADPLRSPSLPLEPGLPWLPAYELVFADSRARYLVRVRTPDAPVYPFDFSRAENP